MPPCRAGPRTKAIFNKAHQSSPMDLVETGKQNVSDQSLVLANIIDGRAYHLHAPILTDHHCIRWSTGERADMSRSRNELSDCLCLMDFSAAAETEKTIKLRNFVHMNLG